MRRLLLLTAMLCCSGVAEAGPAHVGGYFRVAARPDLQGGAGSLGYWNLYGRLMNEGSYGMLELRYDVLERRSGATEPWTTLHVRVEGGSIANADPFNGSLAQYRMSQVFLKTGNVALPDVTWQLGTLEYFYGDLGLYDMRPATIFFDTVGISGRLDKKNFELLVGAGDAGFRKRGFDYSAIPTVGLASRFKVPHFEIGVGGEVFWEPGAQGSRNAPYQTPGINYEDWIRGEVVDRYLEEFPGLEDFFPDPVRRSSVSGKAVGYVGFGGYGPLIWNNFFITVGRDHPMRFTTETLGGRDLRLFIHDFTDQRYAMILGNEMQLRLVPDRLDAVWSVMWGDQWDLDNQIVPTDWDRTFGSTVLRFQAYATESVHLIAETSGARERARNGNAYREHFDSIFQNTGGQPNTRGLEYGDTDTRWTWQGKAGVVLNPLGRGVYNRPSLRLLYGLQYSNVNNAFGNAFVDTVDQYNAFGNVERHWHHLGSAEAEVWF